MKILSSLILLSFILTLSSCKEVEEKGKKTIDQPEKTAVAAVANVPEGVVEEVIHTTSYTYLGIAENSDIVWVAVPKVAIKVGEKVQYNKSMPMNKFYSKELDRTFEVVYFSGGVKREISSIEVKKPEIKEVNKQNSRQLPVPEANSDGTFSGVVQEVIETSYTYLRIKQEKTEFWIAIPKKSVTVGTKVTFADPMEMRDFSSKALNRVFDVIFFVSDIKIEGQTVEESSDKSSAADAAAKPAEKPISVAAGDSGVAIGDLFANRDTYSGKVIRVRGKVTKFNKAIMGKNWVHLQDGTGGPGTNDLLVTTQQVVNVGDVVTFKGKITLKKDFGAGYSYEVLMEEGKIIAE